MWKLIKNTLLLIVLLPFSTPALALNTVTVFADKSFNPTLIDIARNYSIRRDTVVNTAYGTPEQQETQILEGVAADILITPHRSLIENLKTRGLIDVYSDTEIARNRLVLAGPSDSTLKVDLSTRFPVTDIIEATEGEQGFIIANPQYLLDGVQAKEALRNMNVLQDLEPYTLYIRHPGQIIDMISKRGAYAVVFQSTVRSQNGVKVLDIISETAYAPVVYYAVAIAGTNMEEARKFLDYLKSKDTKRMLIASGYIIN